MVEPVRSNFQRPSPCLDSSLRRQRSKHRESRIFYRVRSIDNLGNMGLQDNNGNDYVYFIQGGNSWLFPNQAPGTNMLLNGTQYVSGIKTSLFLNVSKPIAVQVIQLASNPGGTLPAGLSP